MGPARFELRPTIKKRRELLVGRHGEAPLVPPYILSNFKTGLGIANHEVSLRSGLTLLEIVIALTIFFGALTALSQMAWNGSRAAVQARLKTQAIVRCQAKLAEVLSGLESLAPKTKVPFPDNDKWTYSISVAESQFPDLLQVEVLVAHTGNSSLANVDFSLSRWMRDPSLFMEAAEMLEQEAAAETQGSTSQ